MKHIEAVHQFYPGTGILFCIASNDCKASCACFHNQTHTSRKYYKVCIGCCLKGSLIGYIAQWLERMTADQQVPGSNPGVPLPDPTVDRILGLVFPPLITKFIVMVNRSIIFKFPVTSTSQSSIPSSSATINHYLIIYHHHHQSRAPRFGTSRDILIKEAAALDIRTLLFYDTFGFQCFGDFACIWRFLYFWMILEISEIF